MHEKPYSAEGKPRRRWLQFRLSTLLWAFLSVSLAFFLLAILDENRELRRQYQAVKEQLDRDRRDQAEQAAILDRLLNRGFAQPDDTPAMH